MNEDVAGTIIWLLCCWGCAAVFLGIGIFAARREKPMWFWSGATVDPKTVTDIPAYNQENGKMWGLYSVPFWLSGALWFWNRGVAVAVLVLASTLGIAWLIWYYLRIEKRYNRK